MGLALAAMTMMMVACGSDSPKSLADEAVKAAKAGDLKKAEEITKKVEKMSKEEQKEFAAAVAEQMGMSIEAVMADFE